MVMVIRVTVQPDIGIGCCMRGIVFDSDGLFRIYEIFQGEFVIYPNPGANGFHFIPHTYQNIGSTEHASGMGEGYGQVEATPSLNNHCKW
jgi:hypothetical protein